MFMGNSLTGNGGGNAPDGMQMYDFNSVFKMAVDLIITHKLKVNSKVGENMEDTNFTYSIILQKGHQAVGVSGNNLEFIKSMVNTIEFYE